MGDSSSPQPPPPYSDNPTGAVPTSTASSLASKSRKRASRPSSLSGSLSGSSATMSTFVSTPNHSMSGSSRPVSRGSEHRGSNPFRLSFRSSVSNIRESLAASLQPRMVSGDGSSDPAAELSRARARERVRAAEAKAQEMEMLVERLKREGQMGPSATEAELRILQLKYASMKAGSEAAPRASAGLFRTACSTDLLFLMDVTGSMQKYIDSAKNQVKSMVDDIRQAFFNEAELRVAVVGYRDHQDKVKIEFQDFTTDVSKTYAFLDGLKATGGNDPAEDVLGGLHHALTAPSWRHETRCIVHIADAPPHGRALHDMEDKYDNYLEAGSEPHKLQHADILAQMVAAKINYVLLRINSHTDRMAFVFFEGYAAAAPEARLYAKNKFAQQAEASRQKSLWNYGGYNASSSGGLHFEEVELGTSYSSMRRLVVSGVTASASRTAVRMASSSRGSSAYPTKTGGLGGPALDKVSEDDEVELELEEGPPHWDRPGWLDQTVRYKAFSTDVAATATSTSTPLLDSMMASDDNIRISTTELTVRRRSKPFAQGAMRVASYARTQESTNGLVVKSFKAGGKALVDLAEEMRVQALCKAFALEFNGLAGEKHSVDFTVVTCLQPLSPAADTTADACLSLEPLLQGAYVKYNSNCGGVNDSCPDDAFGQAAQAFSHFTFERSQGRFLIADLQGVDHVLTDPAVHTRDHRRFVLTDTNLNEEGFKLFFASHKCNDVCAKLALQSTPAMFMTGQFAFRTDWPAQNAAASAATRVCCANKLCGRIVRVGTAHSSGPGFYWCNTCHPQLDASTVQMLCLEPGAPHEFAVSRFFYESQGQILPRLCPEHRTRTRTPDYTPPAKHTKSRGLFGRR